MKANLNQVLGESHFLEKPWETIGASSTQKLCSHEAAEDVIGSSPPSTFLPSSPTSWAKAVGWLSRKSKSHTQQLSGHIWGNQKAKSFPVASYGGLANPWIPNPFQQHEGQLEPGFGGIPFSRETIGASSTQKLCSHEAAEDVIGSSPPSTFLPSSPTSWAKAVGWLSRNAISCLENQNLTPRS